MITPSGIPASNIKAESFSPITGNPDARIRSWRQEDWFTARVRPFDAIFRGLKDFIASLGIKRKLTGFRCPWQNGALERFNGTLHRELLDHVIVKDEEHLRRLLKEFVRYYHEARTHLGLEKDSPKGRLNAT